MVQDVQKDPLDSSEGSGNISQVSEGLWGSDSRGEGERDGWKEELS